MSGEYPGDAPEGWFRDGDGQAPSAEANPWRASSPDDVTTQMPRVGHGHPADGAAPAPFPAQASAPASEQATVHAAAPAPIPAPADLWGGFDGRQRQSESQPQSQGQQPFPAAETEQMNRPQPFESQPFAQQRPYESQPFESQPFQPDGPDQPGRRPGLDQPGPPRRRRTGLWVASGLATAAVIGVVAVLVFDQGAIPGAGAPHHAAAPKPTPSGFQPSATSPAGDAQQTADAFLTAWAGGNEAKAAALTDDPADAQSALTAYRTGLNLSGLKLTAQDATADGLVTFSVTAQVSSTAVVSAGASAAPSPAGSASAAAGSSAGSATSASGTWTYTSHLTAYQKDGGWYVKWDPALIAPNVTASVHPVALAVKPGAKRVTDAEGNSLSASSQSALVSIAALVKKNAATAEGTAGLEIALEDADGHLVSGSASQLTDPVSTATIKTTIDPHVEALASTAVGQLPRSSMVVLRPSTGAILAVANSSGGGDVALTGSLAPGSDFKVVSTASLLINGMLPQGIETGVDCPLVVTVQGVKIHNSTDDPSSKNNSQNEDYEPPGTPFSTDFAQSCNNAFTQWWQKMAGGKLPSTALNYFGLNQPWDIGLGTPGTYFTMPSGQTGSELAEELYGQGVIRTNPLGMASVAATVETGVFHQPYLVPGLTDLKTATPLPSSVKSQLDTVMREVITSGTAAGVGFGSGVYGKTGTAEADANKDGMPNGWMIVFDPGKDLAIAAVVVDSNFGASTAGPEVRYVLQHY